jgi:type IV pilus assembly protein PilF
MMIFRSALLALTTLLLVSCGTTSPSSTSSKSRNLEAADTQVRLAVGYMQNGKYELALERLKRAVQFDPRSSEAWSTMGVLYEEIKDSAQAEKSYKRAAELEPKKGAPHNNYGQFLCRIGKYDEADREFQVALSDPFYKTPAMAASNAGGCAQRAGRMDVAESYLRKALELDPSMSDAYLPLANILERKGDAMKARAFLQRHEAAGLPVSAEFFALGVRIETRLGDQKSADEYLAQLGQKFPSSEQAKRLGVGKDSAE